MDTQAAIATAAAAYPTVQEANGLIQKFLGPACDEAGELLADKIRVFRLKNQVRTLKDAERILEKEGLSPKAVSLKTFAPLLEAAALEDDKDMASRWANLLATAADPRRIGDIEPSFIEVLKQLTPTQARIVEEIYASIKMEQIPSDVWHVRGFRSEALRTQLSVDKDEFAIAVDNLVRLGLITFSATITSLRNRHARFQLANRENLCATFLGNAFFAACTAPKAL